MASFGGRLDLSFGFMLVGGLIVALPGGLACLLAEWLGTRRRPPPWVGVCGLALGLLCLGGLLAAKPSGMGGALLFPLPPLMTLALVTLLPAPGWRLFAVWCMSTGSLWLIVLVHRPDGPPAAAEELLGGLLGGALTHLVLWHLGFLLGQLGRRRASIAPASGPDWHAVLNRAAQGWRRLDARRPAMPPRRHPHPGFYWWLGGAAVFYLAIVMLSALGSEALLQAALRTEWRITDFFGLTWNNERETTPARMWFTHGLIWSAIAGCGTWGLAARAGWFDAGRLSPLRLAAIVLALCMLLWLVQDALAVRF